ncbi:CdaR family protein [Falsibacillus albus]|uniref:YbbR-like domain-containing protein n=1 Tax=Falsibacillus albus TaxID=2478915 RepID=A0A3L7JSK4_9BACI|nr:CdaR family protein [Falsibacillus albus]RLQ93245.1 YbbR-like domain-containing protein [Falsibacillus albus]
MDKFMENKWVMRILALLLAVLLYISVSIEQGTFKTTKNTTSQQNSDVITDVPLEMYYDSDNLVVSGAPQTVNVTVEGPKSIVQPTKALRDFKLYVDLRDLGIGKHQVRIKSKGISDKLAARIEPAYINVDIEEKVTKEFKVEAEFNSAILADGFEAEKPTVEPKTVKITGAKNIIDKITYVKATIDVRGEVNQTVTREAQVRVLDRELNKLDVQVDPETVDVTLPVKNPSKTVPLKVSQTGTPPEGVKILGTSMDPKEVTIYGKQDVLDTISEIDLPLDVSKIDKDTTVNVPIKLKDGLNKASADNAKVTVDVQKTEEKTFSNLQVAEQGVGDQYDMEILAPEKGQVDLTVKGPSEIIDQLSADDFKLYVDAAGLAAGDHDLNIQVDNPDKNISWTLSDDNMKIRLKEKANS